MAKDPSDKPDHAEPRRVLGRRMGPDFDRQAWLAENRAAIAESNAYVEKHGLPLARFRQF